MADLSFQNIQDVQDAIIPAGTFFVHGTDNKLYIDVDLLIGETGTTLASQRVSEAMYKLNRAARIAQNVYNNNNPASQINTFGALAYAAPVAAPDGITLQSVATVTNNFNVLVDTDEVSAT